MRHPDGLPRVSRVVTVLALLAAGVLAAGCSTGGVAGADPLLFVVVRHAEKVADGSADPPLSPDGQARADALAGQLAATRLAAIYATPLQRTRQTAAPIAQRQDVAVRTYPAGIPAAGLARQLRRDHQQGNVLVVGHSNTVPDIVSALCGCAVAAIDESVYGGRYDVRIDADGRATLIQGGF